MTFPLPVPGVTIPEDAGAAAGPLTSLVWLAVALPAAGFVLNGVLALARPTAKRLVSVIGPGVLVAAFIVALGTAVELARSPDAGPRIVHLWEWMTVGKLRIDLALQVDHLSAVMLLVVTGVGALIHLFSIGYMHDDPGYARYFAYLNLFIVCMLVLVLGSSLPVLFIGWEGVGLCSYLLIGFWFEGRGNADAGKKAFLVNRIGDYGVLIAMFLIWWTLGTLEFREIAEQAPKVYQAGGVVVTVVTLFLFLGCTGKSAQLPLYVWLPDAMAGPTPVSALIHAATMVTAGVYLVVRLSVLFAMAPLTSTIVAGVGALTALFAATIALRQWDIKKVLAFSTISQLGYMFLGVGSGAYTGGLFHVVTHAFFKAVLFLGAGSVIHEMHHGLHAAHLNEDAQDMRNMGGLRRRMPWTFVLMGIATLAIAGVPPLAGFFSKDEINAAAFARGQTEPWFMVFWLMAIATSAITAIYMARLMVLTFFGDHRLGARVEDHVHEAPAVMTGPVAILGVLTVVGGLLNVPELLGGHLALHHWLEPVLEPAQAILAVPAMPGNTELMLFGLATAIAVAGLAAGYVLTRRSDVVPAADAQPDHGLWRLLNQQYYVDDLYRAAIVRPFIWFCRDVLWKVVDQGIIDSVGVEGPAKLSRGLGWLGSRLQNGQVALYVLFFLVGAVWVLGMIAS